MSILKDMIELHHKGFKLKVYEATFRGRRYIPEISGTKRTKSGLAGVSWQSCANRQRALQRCADRLYAQSIVKKHARKKR